MLWFTFPHFFVLTTHPIKRRHTFLNPDASTLVLVENLLFLWCFAVVSRLISVNSRSESNRSTSPSSKWVSPRHYTGSVLHETHSFQVCSSICKIHPADMQEVRDMPELYQHHNNWLIPSHQGRPNIIQLMQCMIAEEGARIIYHPFPLYTSALEDSILFHIFIAFSKGIFGSIFKKGNKED